MSPTHIDRLPIENANKIELIMTFMPGKHIHIIKGITHNTIVGIKATEDSGFLQTARRHTTNPEEEK